MRIEEVRPRHGDDIKIEVYALSRRVVAAVSTALTNGVAPNVVASILTEMALLCAGQEQQQTDVCP